MAQTLFVKTIMTKEKVESLKGTFLKKNDYSILVDYDCDVFCEESGRLLAKFRKKRIPKELLVNSWESFNKAATFTDNRGLATGKIGEFSTGERLKKDGTYSKTSKALRPPVRSGIIGYFDRTLRYPYCRTTAYTGNNVSGWLKCLPVIKMVNDLYRELIPEKWQIQKDYCDRTPKDFVIEDTVFTTITVNADFQTAVHTDKGDLEQGFGNLTVLRKGKYIGGYFVLLQWGVAFDLQNGDILFTDVHQPHGNTPIEKFDKNAQRISLVMYYRENMLACENLQDEIKKLKNRNGRKGLKEK